ncbi:MAG TPA: tetraacyldisaccharide 4'-kinase [Flavobacteriales bacterium]|nr:tetraacyldisaccharide 4'-kinase [Flavobacteriales bacterium]
MTTKILTKTLIRRVILSPITALHGLVLILRHALFDIGLIKSQYAAIPTLVIGNIHAGGTGKTPHASSLLSIFAKRLGGAENVALLSRGYGRKSKGFRWVSEDKDWREFGDEPFLLKQLNPEHPIAVSENRLKGVERIKKERPNVKLVILDDGLQHRALIPHKSIVLLDSHRPINTEALIPGGSLRDLKSRIKKFDAVVYSRSRDNRKTNKSTFSSEMITTGLDIHPPINSAKSRVLAISGIAEPEQFLESLALKWDIIRRHSYPDHYEFKKEDIENWLAYVRSDDLDGIVTTAKDAVRLKQFSETLKGIQVISIPIEVKWHNEIALNALVDEWVESTIFAK